MAAAAPAPVAAEASQTATVAAWPNEPKTVAELDSIYETIKTCPGRAATTLLKVVKAAPRDGSEARDVAEGQVNKLFIAAA